MTDASGRADEWELHARWWQDNFTDGADPEYEEQILPLADEHLAGATRVLDIGCGEGQVARRVADRLGAAARVVGVDASAAQLEVATARGGAVAYGRARVDALPFGAGAFDAVVICLVLEHVPDLAPAVREVARVLEPDGRFVLFVNHPLLQTPGSGWIDDQILEEEYWRIGPYLSEDEAMEELSPGVRLPFMHRPLSRYINVMADSGLLVEHMDEPPPSPGFMARAPEYAGAATIPRLLVLRARKHT